ncbi:phosphotransferase [Ornithinimicrobium faecis]|uniref:Phosphotransferase n=1 Tax=Ornithinimicrobium faecis TaxID=2934158 RepID=A0ABY4YZ95_9MICO|nr:phosphotransferase [Ornithinimicrobium sp. HY1793]USQ81966.1 phosphotransferase [Ornithinimicrobium sp. HY1793]
MSTAAPLTTTHRPVPISDRASADLLIDASRLSELVGREVRATRLRFKPGLSTSAVLLDAASETAPQWIQVSHDAHLDKLRKALEKARERAQRVHLIRTGDLTIAHGTIDTDPRLQKGLDGLRELHPFVSEAVTMGDLQVLRYNPQRRLVLRREIDGRDPEIIRITAHKQATVDRSLAAYDAAGVPVIHPDTSRALAHNQRVTVWPWFGRGDLSSLPTESGVEVAPAAGAALAHLHGSAVPGDDVPEPVSALRAISNDLRAIDPEASARMAQLVARFSDHLVAREWASGPLHGDFSADQVLVGRAGEDVVRLTDFDRAGQGVLTADLGTFAATELTERGGGTRFDGLDSLPLTTALLQGYVEAQVCPSVPTDEASLRPWMARSLLARVTDPFRGADPHWLESIHQRLDQIEELLS